MERRKNMVKEFERISLFSLSVIAMILFISSPAVLAMGGGGGGGGGGVGGATMAVGSVGGLGSMAGFVGFMPYGSAGGYGTGYGYMGGGYGTGLMNTGGYGMNYYGGTNTAAMSMYGGAPGYNYTGAVGSPIMGSYSNMYATSNAYTYGMYSANTAAYGMTGAGGMYNAYQTGVNTGGYRTMAGNIDQHTVGSMTGGENYGMPYPNAIDMYGNAGYMGGMGIGYATSSPTTNTAAGFFGPASGTSTFMPYYGSAYQFGPQYGYSWF